MMVKAFHTAITECTVFSLVGYIEVADVASEGFFFRRRWLGRGVAVADDNSEYDYGQGKQHLEGNHNEMII